MGSQGMDWSKITQIIMPWCDLWYSATHITTNTGQNNNKHVNRPWRHVTCLGGDWVQRANSFQKEMTFGGRVIWGRVCLEELVRFWQVEKIGDRYYKKKGNGTILGDGPGEVLSFKWGPEAVGLRKGLVPLWEEEETQELPLCLVDSQHDCGHPHPRRSPHQTPTAGAAWSRASSLQTTWT